MKVQNAIRGVGLACGNTAMREAPTEMLGCEFMHVYVCIISFRFLLSWVGFSGDV